MSLIASNETAILIHALGWTLVHFCWQGAIVALLLWCALTLLRGGRPQLRYGAACCALVLMLLLPVMTFVRIVMTGASFESAKEHFTAGWIPAFGLPNGQSGPIEPWMGHAARVLDQAMPWILSLWLAGVVLFLLRLNVGLIATARLRSEATLPLPEELHALFRRLCESLAITRTVRLIGSAVAQTPMVAGWLRPVVLIPVGCLTGLSMGQIEAILAHELAHIRRHDYLVSVLQTIVEALLFYHPAVWWVSKQLRKEREYCCDDLAVRVGGNTLDYAKALSLLEENRSSVYITALGANGGVLTMRIKRLLGYEQDPAVSRIASLVVLATAVVASGLWIAVGARADTGRAASKQDAQSAAHANIAPAYRDWLDQDVVWIISPEESRAFLSLANDEERDQFIKQFWLHRDEPGAAPDSYRVEHYRRIAYSNQHFRTAQEAGWKTVRGHIYIAYGRPDELDSHPAGDGESKIPMEMWHYNNLDGIGRNIDLKLVDTCNCGNYILQSYHGDLISQPQKLQGLTGVAQPH
jgi:GWxTD domain-containing protein